MEITISNLASGQLLDQDNNRKTDDGFNTLFFSGAEEKAGNNHFSAKIAINNNSDQISAFDSIALREKYDRLDIATFNLTNNDALYLGHKVYIDNENIIKESFSNFNNFDITKYDLNNTINQIKVTFQNKSSFENKHLMYDEGQVAAAKDPVFQIKAVEWSLHANAELSQFTHYQESAKERNIQSELQKIELAQLPNSLQMSKTQRKLNNLYRLNFDTYHANSLSMDFYKTSRIISSFKSVNARQNESALTRQSEITANRIMFHLDKENKTAQIYIRDFFNMDEYSADSYLKLKGALDFFVPQKHKVFLNGEVIKDFRK